MGFSKVKKFMNISTELHKIQFPDKTFHNTTKNYKKLYRDEFIIIG